MRRVKKKKIQPSLPPAILATQCWGVGDETELGMKGQKTRAD